MSWLATLTRRFWPPDTPLRMGVPISVFEWGVRPKECRREVIRALREEAEMELWVGRLDNCATG